MMTLTLEQLMANTVRRGQCRVWTGTVKRNGMPQISHEGKRLYVTRLVYALTHPNDPCDGGAVVHVHKCRYRSCVAPDHLKFVPRSDTWRYRKDQAEWEA